MSNSITSVPKTRLFYTITLFFLLAASLVSYGQSGYTQGKKSVNSVIEGIIQLNADKTGNSISKKEYSILQKNTSKKAKAMADTQPPTLICPPNQQLACGSLVPSYFGLLTATDDIDTSISVTQQPGAGSDFYDGMTIKFTATDDAGNKSECSIIVTASSPDVTPPTFTCPTGLTFNCGEKVPNYALSPMMNLDDDCSIALSYIMTPGPGSDFYDGIPIQIEYFDKSGNRSVCNFTVTMATPDVTPPVITFCPGTQNLPCGAVLPDYRGLITAEDNCLENMTVSQSPGAGSTFVPGMTVTMTVKDAANNAVTCSFVVNASADITKPTITCPATQSLSCGSVLPDYRSLVTATDNCTASPTITQTPASGSVFTSGMTVTMRAADASGNFADCSFVVNASVDITKPTITCPATQSLSCGSVLPDYRSLVTTADNCTASPTITQTPASGSAFTNGMTITMRATDASGNFADCSFVVNASADIIKPTITCPSNQSLSCGSVLPDYKSLVIANDNCTASPAITQTPASGSVFTSGMTVTMRATDASGNFADCSFVVNASADIIKPTITCPSNQSLSCGSVLPDYRSLVTTADNCTASPAITQTPAFGSVFTSGMTVTMRATDASGNFADCSFVVNASADVTKPTITCPPSQSLALGSPLADYSSLVVSNDNCDSSPTITQSPVPGSIFNANGMTVTMRATDDSGNFATCTFIINNASGDLPPTIECPSGQELFANSTLPNYVFSLTAISDDITDAMDIVFTQTPPQGTLFTADTNVTISAKDESGNVSSCSFLVKVKTTNTTLDCKSNNLYYSNIDGKYGFTIYGEKADGNTGFSVSTAGDVNGDGISDFLIGASGNYDNSYGKNNVLKFIEGSAYLVFGNASGFPPNIDLALLNGTNGFKIRNDIPYTNFQNTGYDVSSAGDINGDGITDFMVSDPYRDTSTGNQNGNTYVVFGRTSGFPAELFLSSLNGTNGFTLIGAINYGAAGRSISSVGDVNGDGTDDIAIVTGGSSAGNGKCYVLYGKTSGFPAQIKTDQINGTNGFVIEGDATVGKVGNNVVGLGDINGDGFPDIGLGSYNGSDQHRKYVVYGRSTNFPATINVASLNGSNGFILENTASPLGGYSGVSRLGDINGDGYNDLVVHESYVLFGSATIPAVMDLKNLNGINGFRLLVAGKTTSIGDFNKDGIGDFGFIYSQKFYAIYGKSDWTTTTIDFNYILYNLKPSQGLKIGLSYYQNYDLSLAGDVNKDGIDDLIIGNSNNAYDVEVNHDPGYAYVIYGKKIEDTEKPVIANCPSDKILTKFDPIPDYKSTITVTDNCDTNPIVTQSPVSGTVFDGVSQEVILTVTDASGNIVTCSFDINSSGADLPPTIECPANQELYANSMLPNYIHFLTNVSDDIALPRELIFTQTPAAGTMFTANTNVTITVEDKSGNTSSCTFLVKLKTGGFEIDCKTTTINANELNGTNGFTLYGEKAATRAGFSTSPVGDVNGDGISDFIIGAPSDQIPEGSYVVFGTNSGFPPSMNLANLDGQNGFKIIDDDLTPPRQTGFDVSSAGDINGDGIDDLMLSDPSKKFGSSLYFSGRVYIIYGKKTGFSSTFLLSGLNGINGFSVLGQTYDEFLGYDIANIGDFNNDSHSDIGIVSANEGSGNTKKCYVLFGSSTNFPAEVNIESLNSSNSFIIDGDIGNNLAGVGDVNGDGISDVAVSGEDKFRYVVYGSASLPATINTNSLNGSNGFKIQNSVSSLETSYYFEIRSAGDLNGDSFNDIGMNNYVLFGKNTTPAVVDLKDLDGTNGFKMNGSTFEYLHTYSSFGDFNQDGFDDYLLPYQNTTIYLIYGKANWNPLLDIFSLNASQGLKISTRNSPKYSLSFIGDVNGDTVDDIIIGSTKRAYTNDPNEDPGMSYVIYGKKSTDTEKPVITNCPDSQILAVNDPIPDYKSAISVTDNCDDNPIITQLPVAGTVFDGVSQEVILTVKDASGNESICSFTVSVLDADLPPTIECPTNLELYANSTLPDYTAFLTSVTDDLTDDFDLIFTQTPSQGTLFTFDTNVTITAKDASGNTKSCSFLVKLKTGTATIDCRTDSFNVSNLNGINGFTIYGEKLTKEAGYRVNNAGDVNGDGISDLIIGAPGNYSYNYGINGQWKFIPGAAYVVFGKSSGFSPNIDLGLLDGSNGFAIRNDNPFIRYPKTGFNVSSAGDLNGDGIGDFMVSDPSRLTSEGTSLGYTYTIFGKSTGFPAEFNLSTLNGSNGFTLIGKTDYESIGSSISSVGDINGDGFTDMATVSTKDKCHVIYGKNGGFPAVLRTDEIDGVNGFNVEGDATVGKIGGSVAGLGDVNGDGIADMGIGSYNDPDQHRKYVIFGRTSNFPTNFNVSLLNGNNGFVVEHSTNPLATSKKIAKAGDINADGFNDMAITPEYILFGKSTFPAIVDLKNLDGTNGFRIKNPDIVGGLGSGFGYAGDFNGDGIDDYFYQTNNKTRVVFGKKNWPIVSETYLESLDIISDLYQVTSTTILYNADYAGDVNNDGVGDLIIGNSYHSYLDHLKVNTNYGMSYVVFGKKLDTEKPIITNCPANQVLAVNDPISDYTKVVTVTDNCDDKPIITQSPVAGTVFDGVSQEVILTATDASGNFETCKFNLVSNADTEKPVITCVANQTLVCGTSIIPDYISLIMATDDVDANPVITQSPVAGSPFVDGMTITMTAKDASNNESDCSFKVNTSADIIKPVVTCSGNQTLALGDALPDYSSLVTVTDNCDASPVITQNPVAGSTFVNGMTVTMTAADVSGNFSTCSFKINASADVTKPVITCIGSQTLSCGSTIVPDYTASVTVTDDVDPSPKVTQSPVAGSSFVDGMTITMTAKDASNNESACSFKVNTSADIIKPVVTCSGDQTLALGDALPDYSSLITATDNCDASPVVTQNPIAGSAFVNGMTVTMTAADVSGNFETCSFKVNASADVTKPIITCVGNQTLSCGSTIVPDYTASVTVTDDVDPSPKVTQSPVAGSPFVDGMTITMTAKDASNNESACSFKVNTSADIMKPVVTCSGDQTLALGDVLSDYSSLVTVTDNCDASPVITQNPVAGSTFVDGMTVTMTATDVSGNFETCSFKVNASADVIKPVITCVGNQTLACGTAVIPDYTLSIIVTDDVDPSPKVTQSPMAGSPFVDGMTITMTAKDASNNESECSFKVNTSADIIKPVVTCSGNQTLALGDALPDYSSLVTVTDNCDASPVITQNPVAGSAFVNGMAVVISAKDASGNTETCSFVINETVDTEVPAITCLADQTLSCKTAIIPDYTKLITVTDNRDSSPIIAQSPIAGSVFTDGMIVTITARDASGNNSECSLKLFKKVVSVNAGNDVYIKEGEQAELEAITASAGSFSWSPDTSLSNPFIVNPVASPTETTTYKVVLDDNEGCTARDFVTVYVEQQESDNTKYGLSPNDDGINDFWKIDTIEEYPNNEVYIYNRWGDLVFYIKNYNNATNVFSGIANKKRNLGADVLPEGTYFFDIKIEGAHHLKKTKGFLVLKR